MAGVLHDRTRFYGRCFSRVGLVHVLYLAGCGGVLVNRKGFATQFIFFICMLAVISIGVVVIYFLYSAMNTAFQSNDQIPAAAKAILNSNDTRFHNVFDYAILTIVVGMMIGLAMISYALRSHPALFFVIMIVVSITGGIAGYLGNAFMETMSTTALSVPAAQFPVTSFIMNNYMIFTIVMGFLMVVAFFANTGQAYS